MRYVSFQDILLKYKLLMTNGDDFFHRHFSADEFCKYNLIPCTAEELVVTYLICQMP